MSIVSEHQVVSALESMGFVHVGKRGLRSTLRSRGSPRGEKLPDSSHMRHPKKHEVVEKIRDGVGSIYIHEPGVIVATGDYVSWFSSLVTPNGRMAVSDASDGVPAWVNDGEVAAVDALLESLRLSTRPA